MDLKEITERTQREMEQLHEARENAEFEFAELMVKHERTQRELDFVAEEQRQLEHLFMCWEGDVCPTKRFC